MLKNDTISAIITPPGEGGIAAIRLSGPDAIGIADGVFDGGVTLRDVPSHTVHFGRIVSGGAGVIDEVLVTVFRSPHSYTAEDVVEISCHGSTFIARGILELLLSRGARLAEGGEFTRRAFLNGRLDLTQAEAVADLIRADSRASHELALSQLRGVLSGKISRLRSRVIDLCSTIELELDFSEEGLELVGRERMLTDIRSIKSEITQLIDSYEHGKIYKDGLRIVLAGSPNVGKSSILNSLIKENRAIVTEIPGTTRDTIEESVVLDGLQFKIVDTAGLRDTHDIVESEGIKRTREQIAHADLILVVIDSTIKKNIEEDINVLESFLGGKSHKETIVVLNKSDLISDLEIKAKGRQFEGFRTVATSTKTGTGIKDLEIMIGAMARPQFSKSGGETVVISNLRQRESLKKANEYLDLVISGIGDNLSGELLAIDLRMALSSLSDVVGVDISNEVLNNIFLRFCIGK